MRITRSRFNIIALLVCIDVLVIYFSLYISYNLRFFSPLTQIFPITKGLPDWGLYNNILYFIIPLWIFIFYQNNMYKVYFIPTLDELIRVVRTITIGIFFLLLTTFFYREFSFSRLTFVLFWIVSIVFLFIYKEIFKITAGYFLRSFIGRESVLLVGRENKILKSILKQHPNFHVTYYPYDDGVNIEKIKGIIQDKSIKQVVLTHQQWPHDKLLKVYDFCESIKVDLKFVPDIVQICRGEITIDSSLGIPIFHLRSVSLSGFNFYFKRAFDLVVSIAVLSVTWPFIMLIMLLIRLDSPGHLFYYHKRMGYRGQVFDFFKFRTMINRADTMLEKIREKSERKGPVFKMSKDPRVTKVGRWLRRYSLDEIPQLINVLRGEMSLVGPRPQVLWEAAVYDDWAKRRLRVLPGITGLWQVSGRAALSYEEMINLDIYYIENWSLGMDLKILFQTIPAIFSKKGAY